MNNRSSHQSTHGTREEIRNRNYTNKHQYFDYNKNITINIIIINWVDVISSSINILTTDSIITENNNLRHLFNLKKFKLIQSYRKFPKIYPNHRILPTPLPKQFEQFLLTVKYILGMLIALC